MAVYEQTYRPYTGRLTPRWSRFLVLARYAWSDIFGSRFFIAVFTFSFVMPLGVAVVLYLRANLGVLEELGAFGFVQQLAIDDQLFYFFLRFQGYPALVLTLLVAPGLVAPDLSHNALPLYLSRPFSRWEYVLGKATVLAVLLSLVTWVPGLLLFFFQIQLGGTSWLGDFYHLAPAVFFGSWIRIVVLSLLGLALSAWVRWRTVAAGLMFALVVVSWAFGMILNATLNTRWGGLVNLPHLVLVTNKGLFGLDAARGDIPVWSAWGSLAVLCGLCLLLLRRKIQAYEIVR